MTTFERSPLEHPSPHRERVGVLLLMTGLSAGPFAWIAQLLTTYALSSDACSSALAVRGQLSLANRLGGTESAVLIAINLFCFILALAGAALSHRNWLRTRNEKQGGVAVLLAAGDGRSRFIAICGTLAGLGFAMAILFNTIEPLMVPACWSVAR